MQEKNKKRRYSNTSFINFNRIILILPLLSFLIGGVDASVEIPVIKQLSQSGFTYEGGIKFTT